MLVPIIIGSLAVFFTYLTRSRQNGAGLKLAFFVIFVFLALRYDYGNDYMAYLNGYNEIISYNSIFFIDVRWEPGWNSLNFLFKPFGFFVMVGFTSLATCFVMYRFIRDFVPSGYQWLAVFLYVFDPSQILIPASAMRQNIAILLFLIAIKFLYKKKIIIYLVLTVVGATFHKSAIMLLPLVLLAYINFKINKLFASVIVLMYASLFLFRETIFSYINPFIESYLPQFAEDYLYGLRSEFSSGLGFIYALFQLGAILYFAGVEFRDDKETLEGGQEMEPELSQADSEAMPVVPIAAFSDIAARRLLFKLAIMTFIFTPLSLQVLMIGRINMYFAPVMIAVIPIILFTTKSRFFHLVFLWSLIPFTLLKFWAFFLSPIWRDKFGTYQTIFSAPQWY
jgi:hypothetical protein